MSLPSWTSEDGSEDRPPSVGLQTPPSPSPPIEWSSDSEDHVPLARRWAAGGAPLRGRRPGVGTSSRAEESPGGVASSMTRSDLERIRARYRIPREIDLFLPTPDDRVISSRPGRVAFYEVCLQVGLRPPFHPFFITLLDFYSLTPSQLVPNSCRVISAFVILCHRLGITPRVSLFRNFYSLRAQKGWWVFQPRPNRVLKLLLPSSIKGWKPRFFFANIDQVRPRWGDPDLRGNTVAVQPGDREAMGLLLTVEIPRYTLLLAEDNFELAGLVSHRAMKVPRAKLIKAAKKRGREGPSGGQQAPAPKRSVIRASPPALASPPGAPQHVPVIAEVDLTADTPPEAGAAAGATAIESVAGEPAPTEGLPVPEGATPSGASRDWGEGPSGPASPPPEGSVRGDPHTEPGGSEAAEGGGGVPRPPLDSLGDGHWAERVLGPVLDPRIIEGLGHQKTGEFFRESYAAVVRIAHSLKAAREVIRGGKNLLREAQDRAEAAERALEKVKESCANEVRAAESRAEIEANRARAAISQMTESESAVMARDIHISELTSALREAEERAGAASEEARVAREEAGVAKEEAGRYKEETGRAREAERAAAEALAAEKARAAGLVEEYRSSERFTDDLAEASAAAFLDGFQYAKERVAKDLNFPRALEVELEQSSDLAPSDDEPAPAEP